MVATCAADAMLYVLPMLLGRTYNMQHDTVGIDIYDAKDIEQAKKGPLTPFVDSLYRTIENSDDKRKFLDLSGDLELKIGAGLLDIRGAGEYLKDTSNLENTVGVLIKMSFLTFHQEISTDAKPLKYWQHLDRKSVGTHVVTSLTYGGEVYASVNFVAHKSEDFESIKAEITGSISKSDVFDLNAQAKLEKIAQNISSKAKMEIDYYATVPLETVPRTLEDLRKLVGTFRSQVEKVNNGLGVPVCAGLRKLSEFDDKFTFFKNSQLVVVLRDEFNYLFNNLREAKALLINLVSSLPEMVTKKFLDKIIDFSGRLTDTLRIFHDVIGNMDLEKGSEQLSPAETAFDKNSPYIGDTRYTTEVKELAKEMREKDDPNKPRGVYVRWGKRTCGPKATNSLYIGFMSSFIEQGVGAGTNYQCLPEKPNLKLDPEFTGLNARGSKLAGVRFRSMSVFKSGGKNIENKVVPCTVCETPMRPTIQMYPAMSSCPSDWVQEYAGFLVSNNKTQNRAEFVCVDYDPDTYDFTATARNEPIILPVKMGEDSSKKNLRTVNASLPCVVCSK